MRVSKRLVDELVSPSRMTVLAVADEPLVEPVAGDTYIVGDNPTGAFAEADSGMLARYDGESWEFTEPGNDEVINADNGQLLRHTASGWVCVASLQMWMGNKLLTDLEVVDAEKRIAEVGEDWDYSNLRVIARYTDGTGVDVTDSCTFSETGKIEAPGEYNIEATYSDGRRSFSLNFIRPVVGSNAFVEYVKSYSELNNVTLYLTGLNGTAINSDNPAYINIYSRIIVNGILRNVVVGNADGTAMNCNIGMNNFTGHIDFTDAGLNYINTGMFWFNNSTGFNGTVGLPSAKTNYANLFKGCNTYNHPTTIPDGVTNCYQMFFGCSNFNQPLVIPDSVTNIVGMLNSCFWFNSP